MSEAFLLSQGNYSKFVGDFLLQYATLEHTLRAHLKGHAGLSEEMYEILVGIPRTGDMVAKLKKIIALRVEDPERQAQATRAFAQLDEITKLRDRIVHYGGNALDTGQILIRVKPTETVTDTGKAYALYDMADLWPAFTELQRITMFLSYLLGVVVNEDGAVLAGDELKVRLDEQAPPAEWRYKSPKLDPKQR